MGRSREIATGDVERKGNQSTMPPEKKSKKHGGGKAKKDGGAGIEDTTPITVEEQEPHMDLVFYGKTKSPNSLSVFAVLDSVADDGSEIAIGEDDGGGEFGFDFGKKKKKKSKKKKKGGGMIVLAEEEDDENSEITVKVNDRVQDEKDGDLDFDFGKKQKSEKKKRSNTSAQEEDDLNKILAELGEGPASSSASPLPFVEKPLQVQSEAVLADAVETAAAKKKKRKKEKKAAAEKEEGQVKEEAPAMAKAKAAVGNKKVPKHVREMQEALARRKEEEERRRREEEEEEERRRRAEEEMLRREEEERMRQDEEAKRRKKEREKEKLLKKKQEGKQKEEKRRLEAMRRQYPVQNEVPVPDASVEVKKRPKYESKKSKQKVVEAEKPRESLLATAEPEADQDKEAVLSEESQSQEGESEDKVEAKQEQEEVEAVVEDEDEEEWDAKSWDDVSLLATSPFAEDKEEDDAEPAVKKGASLPVEPPKKTAAPHQLAKKTDAEMNATEREEAMRKKEVANKKQAKASEGRSSSGNELRSPICCILGHVDAGKTKLLDCIRRTNVQEGEAGGITQQIGATFFPTEYIRERTKELKADAKLKVPGLLVIDTPGHESFKNLRSRGSSLCDIAVLVVDIMHGLEPQTIESLNLLKSRRTEFIVALNKVDRLYGWKSCPNAPIAKAMKQQSDDVRNEFKMRLTQIITEFKEQGLNTALYYKKKEWGETFNIVPTSAISGEGIPDLLLLLIQWVQRTMEKKLTYVDEVECTVMEVKVSQGLATTIDVVLVNGCLHKGDQIVVCGLQGPIVTNIKALLTPRPMKELWVKGTYLQHGRIKGAQCVKISAQDLESAIAGTALYVVRPDDDLEYVMEAVMQDMNKVMSRIDKSGEGVHVQASTLGSLEALIDYLKSPAVNIPFSGFGIGPVHKKDVMKASVMLERRKKEYAAILAFDVKITPEARDAAKKYSVPIFEANVIYHLFDQFKTHVDNFHSERKRENAEDAVFPCLLKINCVIHKKDPILLGVDVFEGILKVGTPFCILSSEFTDIGKIASIEINNKQVPTATKGQNVAIQIVGNTPEEQQKKFVQHIEKGDELVSRITRKSIDVLEADYWTVLSEEDRELVFKLKKIFKIL